MGCLWKTGNFDSVMRSPLSTDINPSPHGKRVISIVWCDRSLVDVERAIALDGCEGAIAIGGSGEGDRTIAD
ncbi:MAG: hypothetical protein F6K09_25300 [Merismopedia sp. SIO2A8]|nr:hypothetical protein [Symploca sp. SIO2B6]NET51893.1 hypothetical protein [Merismopedia sp. SIO2A8]